MLLKLLGAKALSGMEQCVVALLPGGAMAEPMRVAGAAVAELNFLGGMPVLAGSARLASLARRFRPQLLQGWLYHGNLGATLARAAVGGGVPLVWGVRQSLPSLQGENAFARVGIRLNKALSSAPERVLFNSTTSLDQHRAFGFDMRHAEYLPNGFDTTVFAPDAQARAAQRQAWGFNEQTVVFGVLARYHPAKDHAGFLQAARQVLNAQPGARFVMAGTGVDTGNPGLLDTIAALELQQHVRLLGERRDVAAVLNGLDVYVSSSGWIEAFSNSIGEAMSCALPCVVTRVGDSPHIVADTGRAVPPGDPEALADAMIAVARMDLQARRALGAAARQRIVSRFSLEGVAQRYAVLYNELVAAARPPH